MSNLEGISLNNNKTYFNLDINPETNNPSIINSPASSANLEEIDLSLDTKTSKEISQTSNQVENDSIANMSPLDTFRSESTEVINSIKNNYEDLGYKSYTDKYGMTHVKPSSEDGNALRLSNFKDRFEGEEYDYEIVECIFDKDTGLDSLIVKDQYGNLRITYGYTQPDEGDIKTDVIAGANDKLEYISLSNEQTAQAEQVAEYAYQMAKENGTKLNFFGYSLGGSDTESGILYLYNHHDDAYDMIDSVTLLNPLHAPDLSDKDVENLTGSKNFKYYANEMDIVHTINSFEKFKDLQITLPAVTEGEYAWTENQSTEDRKISLIESTQNQGHMIEYLYTDEYINENFDENGNLKNISNNKYDTNELLKKYYGFELEDFNSLLKNEIDTSLKDAVGTTGNDYVDNIIHDGEYMIADLVSPDIAIVYELVTTDFTDPQSVYHAKSKIGASILTRPTDYFTDLTATALDAVGLSQVGDYLQKGNEHIHKGTYDLLNTGEELLNEDIELGRNIIQDISEGDIGGVASDVGQNLYNKGEILLTKAKELYDDFCWWIPFGH